MKAIMQSFKGILLTKSDAGFNAALTDIDVSQLPTEGDVTAAIEYSTINYKDGLAICNKSPVVRKWPMVAGIDGAGTVIESQHPDWEVGDKFIHTGYGVGETHWGCLAEKARLKGEWLVPLPASLTTRQAMAIGTAGFTAMLAVMAITEHGITPADGEILVTGAAGGVGSVAITLLAARGFSVVASTGRMEEAAFLQSLGATSAIDRNELSSAGKPLQKERWAGVVDSVGSHTLVNALAQCRYGGVVAACGLAQGIDLPGSVAPFILRGVTLAGIDSVNAPQLRRRGAWELLATTLDRARLDAITTEIGLSQTIEQAAQILAGKVRGRTVVDVRP